MTGQSRQAEGTVDPRLLRFLTTCRRCGRQMAFARTAAGRAMPVDLVPSAAGNVALHVDSSGRLVARVLTSTHEPRPFERVHMPHFATCCTSPKPLTAAPDQPARL